MGKIFAIICPFYVALYVKKIFKDSKKRSESCPSFNIMTETPCTTREEKIAGAKLFIQYFTPDSNADTAVSSQVAENEARFALNDREGGGHFGFITNRDDEVVGFSYFPVGGRQAGKYRDRQSALRSLPHQTVSDVQLVLEAQGRRGIDFIKNPMALD